MKDAENNAAKAAPVVALITVGLIAVTTMTRAYAIVGGRDDARPYTLGGGTHCEPMPCQDTPLTHSKIAETEYAAFIKDFGCKILKVESVRGILFVKENAALSIVVYYSGSAPQRAVAQAVPEINRGIHRPLRPGPIVTNELDQRR